MTLQKIQMTEQLWLELQKWPLHVSYEVKLTLEELKRTWRGNKGTLRAMSRVGWGGGGVLDSIAASLFVLNWLS